ncbi:MAG: exodeoxyribonuclease III [Bacteroidales bacterium]|nr:exodeoxyribonuclease III [Bacteroidales bacterium]
MPRIITYNVNGIRAAIRKGFVDWLENSNPDIVLFQETKAVESQIPIEEFERLGYYHYWFSAEKKGYSGVGILSKEKPDKVHKGMGIDKYDREGRFIRADYGPMSVISVYHPSGTNDDRLQFKFEWLDDFQKYIDDLKKERPDLVISGDYNICHKPIDIHDPVRNKKVSGFLPEEREWLDGFVSSGFSDAFRIFNQQPHQYTWWSYRANARAKNKGWRIDYHMVAEHLKDKLNRAVILPEAKHSDHCPVLIDIDFQQ